jgi:hypothetical protein
VDGLDALADVGGIAPGLGVIGGPGSRLTLAGGLIPAVAVIGLAAEGDRTPDPGAGRASGFSPVVMGPVSTGSHLSHLIVTLGFLINPPVPERIPHSVNRLTTG